VRQPRDQAKIPKLKAKKSALHKSNALDFRIGMPLVLRIKELGHSVHAQTG